MHIFAHRGLLFHYPENSLISFQKAVEAGFGLELDLHLTRDHDFLVIHDDNTHRLTGEDKLVQHLTLDQATQMRYANSSECLLSFRNLLTWWKIEKRPDLMAVQLKLDSQNDVGLEKLVAYFREFDLFEEAFVFDLTVEAAGKLKRLEPKIKTSLIVSDYIFEPTIYDWEAVKELEIFDIVWAAEHQKLYTKEFADSVRAERKTFYAVSPDLHRTLGHPRAHEGYEETWKELIAMGAEGICTDYPEKLKELLSK